MAKYEQTLCWQCQNTNRHKCSWFDPDNPQPVPGWVAELRPVKGVKGDSYMVRECPNFDPIPKSKPLPKAPVRTESTRGVHRGVRHWVARISYKGQRYYLGYGHQDLPLAL